MEQTLIWLIRGYQKVCAKLALPPTCRFWPSCSEYSASALKKYGLFPGLIKALWRLLRCQGFSRGGFDPLN